MHSHPCLTAAFCDRRSRSSTLLRLQKGDPQIRNADHESRWGWEERRCWDLTHVLWYPRLHHTPAQEWSGAKLMYQDRKRGDKSWFSHKSGTAIDYEDHMKLSNTILRYHFHVAVTQMSKHERSFTSKFFDSFF